MKTTFYKTNNCNGYKIAVVLKGITWIHNTHKNLRKAISEGMELRSKHE